MTNDTGRTPAWRRLGLALKNEDQSAATVPELHTQRSETQHGMPFDVQKDAQQNFQLSGVLAVNGKSLSLGKRKPAPEPAEESGQTFKKSRTSRTKHEATGVAIPKAPIITNADNAEVEIPAAQEAAPADTTIRPKGDPNYRKKKVKPNKRRRQDEQVAPTQFSTSPDEYAPAGVRPTLLASTETDHRDPAPVRTPQRQFNTDKSSTKDSSGSPDRRKSVAFTPDTKTTDGHTGQDLFKKWVSEVKGAGTGAIAPKESESKPESFNIQEEKRRIKARQQEEPPPDKNNVLKHHTVEQGEQSTSTASPITNKSLSTAVKSSTRKGQKKDPSVYIAYLIQYHTSRDHWKFNKAKQNDVVENALNIFRIPEQHSEALLEYISGLKGAGVIDRLRETCISTLKELEEQDLQSTRSMDEPNVRKAAQEEALQERITKEAKRRKVEGDAERLHNHPHGDGYIRRLQRTRAEALLTALGRTAPVLPAPAQTGSITSMTQKLGAPPKRDSRKRKRRGDISSDESSSDSSTEESSSSESESEDGDDLDSDSSTNSDAATSISLRSAKSGNSNSNSGSNSETSRSSGSGSGSDTDSDSDSD